MMKKLLILVLLLICINTAVAATIHGNVYDLYLDKQSDAIVTVDTIPKQTFVAKNGTYSFEVPIGDYELKAEYYNVNELVSSTEEKVSIADDGDFVVDLILFPSFLDEEEFFDESDLEINGDSIWDKLLFGGFVALLIKAIIVLVTIIVIIFIARKALKNVNKIERKIELDDEKDLADEVLKFIKTKKRTTQKDIRKKFFSSEAKISLVLTELEHKGKIEKIKKGRGNVIILK